MAKKWLLRVLLTLSLTFSAASIPAAGLVGSVLGLGGVIFGILGLVLNARMRVAERGCCGCGAPVADIRLERCGETYCWPCIDSWPIGSTPLHYLGMTVLPGRERGPR